MRFLFSLLKKSADNFLVGGRPVGTFDPFLPTLVANIALRWLEDSST
jgi:hypothetical protein